MIPEKCVPFFPFKFNKTANSITIDNPILEKSYEINPQVSHLLYLCDGYRTWSEITNELRKMYIVEKDELVSKCNPILNLLEQDGILWLRKQRMTFNTVPPPQFVLWNLTNLCNHRCRHCVVNASKRDVRELTMEQCIQFIDDIASYGVKALILSGGEPVMHPFFMDIVSYAHDRGLYMQVASNGTKINLKTAKELSQYTVTAQVSLDGSTSVIHDDFRQSPGGWRKTIKGIKNLVDAGIVTIVAATVTKMNIHDITNIYMLTKELGVDTFRIIPFVPYGRGLESRSLEVSPIAMKKVTQKLLKLREKYNFPIVPMEFECTLVSPPDMHKPSLKSHVGCDGAIAYCTVTSEGDVLPCNFFTGVKTYNIKEKSFKWIWENCRFLNYFRSLNISDIKGICNKCSWLKECRGSCVAANYVHGDIFQSNCHCWVAAEKTKNFKAKN